MLLELLYLIYRRLLIGFDILFFFTNLSLMEFQVRYLPLFLLFPVIGSFASFWMEKLQKNVQLMLEFLKTPLLFLYFSYYTLMTFLMMLSVMLLSMLLILFSTLKVTGTWSMATTRIGFWTWIWSTRHCGLGQEVACSFQCWENSAGFVWPV